MERRLRRVEWVAILVSLAAILTITFWPTPVDRPFAHSLSDILAQLHSAGVPAWVDYNFVQTASNVVIFLPLGALIASVVWTTFWWMSGVLGLALSLSIELTQYLVLPARFATAGDIIANTSGALLGGLIVAAFHAARNRIAQAERQPAAT
jgi:glycopeptide antibiotics resistance protein